MNITSVEVIRGNPGVGVATRPVRALPGENVILTYGDTLRVNTSFDYRGQAMETTLEGAVGKLHVFPTEWLEVLLKKGTTIDLPDSPDFTPCERSVDIPITSDIGPGTDYDLSASLLDYREAGHPTIVDVIDIVGIPPTYELLEETIYPYAYVYDGPTEGGTITFKTDPFTPASWIAGRLASHAEDEIKKQGGRMLEMRVYADKSPLLWTNWRIDVISSPPETTAGLGVSIGIPVWVAIILVCLALIALIIVTYNFIIKPLTYKHKGISPELKAPMSRETLTTLAHDYEVKLEETKPEFTPKPPEEIEAMSDDELRDYCDVMAEWIAPVPPDWLPLAILGGLGVLGIGGVAAAYALSKPTGE